MLRNREGTIENGIHWENMDEIYYLKNILNTQKEMLGVLKNIDSNILKYFGDEKDKKIKEINEVVKKGGFKVSQKKTLLELMKLSQGIPEEIIDKNINCITI